MIKKLRFLLGFGLYITLGSGASRPFWQALSLYTHKFIYARSTPYNYKRLKDMWKEDLS